jgi:hypothetical protein
MTALSVVIGLVALGAVIEVVGHELVGFRHTLRAWRRDPAGSPLSAAEPRPS